jgi:hypothetical protein
MTAKTLSMDDKISGQILRQTLIEGQSTKKLTSTLQKYQDYEPKRKIRGREIHTPTKTIVGS